MSDLTSPLQVLAQTDAVSRTLWGLLLLMSILSWTIIVVRLWSQQRRRARSELFLQKFWQAPNLQAVASAPAAQHSDPFAALTAQALLAQRHHQRLQPYNLADAGSLQDFVTRTLRQALDEQALRMEQGLASLATVGATAPFVGLFGTVWGVYHALTALGVAATATLDQIAGPVGEALIMTALGLAVAIPAVVAYNALIRSNRVLQARLDSFAFALLTLVTTGEPLSAATQPAQGA